MRGRLGACLVGTALLVACVSDTPDVSPSDAGGDDGSGDGGPLADGGGGDSAVVACTESSTCPAATPTCANGVCTTCAAGSDGDCATYHAATPKCGPAGACVECVVKADCAAKAATTPFCGPKNTCVECLTANDCGAHVCGSDNACRLCEKHAECPSGACAPDGNCVSGASIAYVDNRNVTIAACRAMFTSTAPNGQTPATAYCDIVDALGGKPYVVVTGHGTTAPYSPLTNVTNIVTLVGPGYTASPPAVISTTASGPAVVQIATPGGAPGVTIDGFEITSSNHASGGISCSAPAAANHAFRVRNTYVHDNLSDAIFASNCDMTIEDSKVTFSDQHAVYTSNSIEPKYVIQRSVFLNGNGDGLNLTGDVTFDRNIVANYTQGVGLQVNFSHPFRITNSFFYLNRNGIEFNSTSSAPVRVFQFNTIAYNTTSAFNGGCDPATPIESSIIVDNADAPNSVAASAGCVARNVVTDNVGGAPVFVNSSSPAAYDFHLATDTPAHVAANKACCIDKVPPTYDAGAPLSPHDFDGTTRPEGAGYDIGAHEAQ